MTGGRKSTAYLNMGYVLVKQWKEAQRKTIIERNKRRLDIKNKKRLIIRNKKLLEEKMNEKNEKIINKCLHKRTESCFVNQGLGHRCLDCKEEWRDTWQGD